MRSWGIIFVNTVDYDGGAAAIARSLFEHAKRSGIVARFAVGRKNSECPDVIPVPNVRERRRVTRLLLERMAKVEQHDPRGASKVVAGLAKMTEPGRLINRLLGVEDFHYPGTKHLLELIDTRPTLIHAHNLHGHFFDLRFLPRISQTVPTMITLHDQWLFTGHCAYSIDCRRWQEGCGKCPDLSRYPAVKRDATAKNWRRKRDIFQKSKLFIASPAQWLIADAELSILRNAIIESRVIPNGIDLSVFRPGDMWSARRALGLPEDSFIILHIGAKSLRFSYKDYSTLAKAFQHLRSQMMTSKLLLLVLGGIDKGNLEEQPGVIRPGHVADPLTMAMYYRASNIFVHSTLADTFPTTVLEAMACGTPVVASKVGGVPEQIQDGSTGFLVRPQDPAVLARTLAFLTENQDKARQVARRARSRVKRRYGRERMIRDYFDWYAEIMHNN